MLANQVSSRRRKTDRSATISTNVQRILLVTRAKPVRIQRARSVASVPPDSVKTLRRISLEKSYRYACGNVRATLDKHSCVREFGLAYALDGALLDS